MLIKALSLIRALRPLLSFILLMKAMETVYEKHILYKNVLLWHSWRSCIDFVCVCVCVSVYSLHYGTKYDKMDIFWSS